jgi:hypothetical protein
MERGSNEELHELWGGGKGLATQDYQIIQNNANNRSHYFVL